MALFHYKVSSRDGHITHGVVEATSVDQAMELLMERGFVVIELSPETYPWIARMTARFFRRVKIYDLLALFRQLSVLVSSGIPLVQAFEVVINQTSNKKFIRILEDIKNEVEGGSRLSAAMHRYPSVFNSFIVNMIFYGESSGQLDLILDYITDKEERDYELSIKIKSILLYPFIILSALFIMAIILLVFIVPRFLILLESFGGELPLTTRMFIAFNSFVLHFYWLIFIIFIVGAAGFVSCIHTVNGKRIWYKILLSLPGIGNLLRQIFVVRFAQSLSVLLRGGVPLLTSLQIVSQAVDNEIYRRILANSIREVENGNPLALQFRGQREIPQMVSQMIATGEQTGSLSDMLEKLSVFYRKEVDASVTFLVGIIEPLILVVLGIAVGFVMSAILLPLYNLTAVF